MATNNQDQANGKSRKRQRAKHKLEEVGAKIEKVIGELISDRDMENDGAIRELDAKIKRAANR